MIESAYFWSVSGVVKISFIDCHLVMGDYIHHDKGCISTSNFEAVSFKMLQHVTNTRCFNLSVGDISRSPLFRPTRRYLKFSAYPNYFIGFFSTSTVRVGISACPIYPMQKNILKYQKNPGHPT